MPKYRVKRIHYLTFVDEVVIDTSDKVMVRRLARNKQAHPLAVTEPKYHSAVATSIEEIKEEDG